MRKIAPPCLISQVSGPSSHTSTSLQHLIKEAKALWFEVPSIVTHSHRMIGGIIESRFVCAGGGGLWKCDLHRGSFNHCDTRTHRHCTSTVPSLSLPVPCRCRGSQQYRRHHIRRCITHCACNPLYRLYWSSPHCHCTITAPSVHHPCPIPFVSGAGCPAIGATDARDVHEDWTRGVGGYS